MAAPWYLQDPLPLPSYNLFDLGVADIDENGYLDIFTTAHSATETLLLTSRDGTAEDVFYSWGLEQARGFPGFEDTGSPPKTKAPGIYIYWHRETINIVTRGPSLATLASGRIALNANVKVLQREGFEVSVNSTRLETGVRNTSVDFQGMAEGSLVVQPSVVGVQVGLTLNPQIPLACVHIGSRLLHPGSHNFGLGLRDRHAMAWADFNGDGFTDVFIARGGLRGRIENMPQEYPDELLLFDSRRFQDVTLTFGLVKGDCRARQAAWVDFDGDGLLDLYVSCVQTPNQLHRQEQPGKFVNIASDIGLDFLESGKFVWLDVESDGDMDLLFSSPFEFALSVNEFGAFSTRTVATSSSGSRNLSVWDYDNDGDLDVFSASPGGNALLVNHNGDLEKVTAQSVRLPARSASANWVDYDNDGLVDLYSIPGGLYRQLPDHTFEATGLLDGFVDASSGNARATWFDADNDGYRDLLAAGRPRRGEEPQPGEEDDEEEGFWDMGFHHNPGGPSHWLEIQLIGPRMNRQAIGATVTVTTPQGTQMQQVGSAEGSQHSQGHYRLYFGLGQSDGATTVRVRWPDGTSQELINVLGDRLLTIKYTEAIGASRE